MHITGSPISENTQGTNKYYSHPYTSANQEVENVNEQIIVWQKERLKQHGNECRQYLRVIKRAAKYIWVYSFEYDVSDKTSSEFVSIVETNRERLVHCKIRRFEMRHRFDSAIFGRRFGRWSHFLECMRAHTKRLQPKRRWYLKYHKPTIVCKSKNSHDFLQSILWIFLFSLEFGDLFYFVRSDIRLCRQKWMNKKNRFDDGIACTPTESPRHEARHRNKSINNNKNQTLCDSRDLVHFMVFLLFLSWFRVPPTKNWSIDTSFLLTFYHVTFWIRWI